MIKPFSNRKELIECIYYEIHRNHFEMFFDYTLPV